MRPPRGIARELQASVAAERAHKCDVCNGLRTLTKCDCASLSRSITYIHNRHAKSPTIITRLNHWCRFCGGSGLSKCHACGGTGQKKETRA